jgi:hypothetical protein
MTDNIGSSSADNGPAYNSEPDGLRQAAADHRAAPSAYEPSHVFHLLVQALRDISSIGGKCDRAISAVSEVNKQVHELQINYAWIKGCAATAVVLIPLCAIIVWWLIGDKLNDIKAQVLQARPAHSTFSSP